VGPPPFTEPAKLKLPVAVKNIVFVLSKAIFCIVKKKSQNVCPWASTFKYKGIVPPEMFKGLQKIQKTFTTISLVTLIVYVYFF
jgi:hypothetical protein